MKPVKQSRRKPAARIAKKVRLYSTSEARANFAEALEAAHSNNALIGFDRYGRTIAVLAPVEAIYLLAGMGNLVAPSARDDLRNAAKHFLEAAALERPPSRRAAIKGGGTRGGGNNSRKPSLKRLKKT